MIWEPSNQPRWRGGRRAEVHPGERSARERAWWRHDLLAMAFGVIIGVAVVVVLILT